MIENDLARSTLDTSVLAWARGPRLRELKTREIESVLARNNVARIAFVGNGRAELFPVHYVYANGTIVGRTSLGTKYLTWLTRSDVVLEIDESNGLFDWRSVIVRGTVTILTPRGSPSERVAYNEAVSAVRKLVPGAFTERDPTPQRAILFAIAPREMTGRHASTH